MNSRPWILLASWWFPALVACTETKDLSPPPLNPHPKEALHITVSFDRPDDGKRYGIVMRAHYRNMQSECGYVEANWNRRFIYPEGTFDIPNESHDPRQARFTIYLDRYKRDQCNWEFTLPNFLVVDTHTGLELTGDWGLREEVRPGAVYKAICPFRASDFAGSCFGRFPVPDSPWYDAVPAAQRIPITVRVGEDSVPLRPRPPSAFDHFVKPVATSAADPSPSTSAHD